MNWIVVKKFPLEKDLTHITGFLHERSIAHKIYEEAGEQVIAVSDARIVASVAQFLQDVERGNLVIEAHPDHQPAVDKLAFPPLWIQIKDAPITALLILFSLLGACIVEFEQSLHLTHWLSFSAQTPYGTVPFSQLFAAGQFWRLLTPVFLHFGFLHVLFNSLWMWDFGRRIEFLLGKSLYVIFFLVTGIFSNVAQYLWESQHLFGGMSGVIYGLVGYIIVCRQIAPNQLVAVPNSILIAMLIWLVVCMTGLIDYLMGGGVANAAHVGGLIAGCVFALVTLKKSPKSAA